MPVKKIIIAVILFLLLIVIFQNLTVVDVRIIFWTLRVNLLLVILLPLLAGMVIGWFFRSFYAKRQKNNHIEKSEESKSIT
jgi:uncharacterized integral membrane protein